MLETALSIDLQLLQLRQTPNIAAAKLQKRTIRLQAKAEQINYARGIAEAMLLHAQSLWGDMEYALARKKVREAITYARKNRELDLLAEGYHLLALIFVANGEYTNAMSKWLQSIKLCKLLGQDALLIDILIGLGNLWTIDQQSEKVLHEFNDALERARSTKNELLSSKAAVCLSREHLKLGLYHEALASLNHAEMSLYAINNTTWHAEIYNYRAQAWLALGNAEQAQIECAAAWQLVREQKHLVWAQCLTLVCRAQVQLHQQQSAQLALDEAEALAQRFKLIQFISQIALIRSQIAEQEENWDEALAQFKLFRHYDLGELATHQSQRDFLSTQFNRLANQIDQQLASLTRPQLELMKPVQSNSDGLPRYLWMQHFSKIAATQENYGVFVLQFNSLAEPFVHGQRMRLLSAQCEIQHLLCHYAQNFYAILLPNTTAIDLSQLQADTEQLFSIVRWEKSPVHSAIALGKNNQAPFLLLEEIQSQLAKKLIYE